MKFFYFFILIFGINNNLYCKNIIDTEINTDLNTPISYLCNINELKKLDVTSFDFKKLPKSIFKEKYVIENNGKTKYSFLHIKNVLNNKNSINSVSTKKIIENFENKIEINKFYFSIFVVFKNDQFLKAEIRPGYYGRLRYP